MTRHVSGIFLRADRVRVAPGETIALAIPELARTCKTALLELGLSDMLLAGAPPPVGSRVSAVFVLQDRYIELALPGVVTSHAEHDFSVRFAYLTLRQTYGLTLAMDLYRQAALAAGVAPSSGFRTVSSTARGAAPATPAPIARIGGR